MGEIKKIAYQNLISLQKELLIKTRDNEKIKRDFYKEKKDILLTLLDFSDNYENILLTSKQDENVKLIKRIKLLKRKYDRILTEMGVEIIDVENIDINNIDYNNVIIVENTFKNDLENDFPMLEVVKKGYLYQNKVLRPIEVILKNRPKD